uniref:Uncharacterized protein n=1 Tax=Ditylum brightwellii TaxID=49249 RepID=A0A7S4T3V8_9STRA
MMRKNIAPQHLLQSKTSKPNIADDRLRQAADGFHTFTAKLKKLNVAVKAYHQDTVRAQASRARLVSALSDVASDSPLSSLMRTSPDQQDGSIVAYANTHKRAVNSVQFSLERYQNEMITYVDEWETTISNRICTELRHVESLHKNWAKYDSKVASLKSASEKKTKKKDSDSVKIGRNESKLRTARKEYRRNLISLTLLTEEVTERGWKDLVPLMLKMLEFDIETSHESVELMERLKEVQDEFLCLAHRYEMGDGEIRDGRLKMLLEDDALEFVRTEDRRDIESLQPSINTSTPLLSRSHSSSTESNDLSSSPIDVKKLQTIQSTPPTSESDLSPGDKPSRSEQPEVNPEQTEQPKITYVRKETIPDIENESVDERGRAVMPTSIYLQFDEDGVASGIDDMTTLTPYPDRASV